MSSPAGATEGGSGGVMKEERHAVTFHLNQHEEEHSQNNSNGSTNGYANNLHVTTQPAAAVGLALFNGGSDGVPVKHLQHQPSSGYSGASTVDMPRLPPVQITFKDLVYKVKSNQKKQAPKATDANGVQKSDEGEWKTILKGISGTFKPGRFTAIMGSSGAGKTTLLNAISCQQGSTVSITDIKGDILVNGKKVAPEAMHTMSCYIQQEDIVLGTQTVYDTILLHALLKLPKTMPREEKVKRAEDIIRLLELEKCRDTIVGDQFNKGISGGEKRRVSVGMELVLASSLIFLDEPTSGLDSSTAFTLIQILRDLAHVHQRTVVCTIHQPPSDVYHLFDDLLLLSDGQTIYSGPASDAVDYFNQIDSKFVCPPSFNPADHFFMSVLNDYTIQAETVFENTGLDTEQPTADNDGQRMSDLQHRKLIAQNSVVMKQRAEESRVNQLLTYWKHSSHRKQMDEEIAHAITGELPDVVKLRRERPGFLTQFHLLARRRWYDLIRDRMKIRAQSVQYFFFAIILGLTFLRLGHGQTSVQDREGSLFFLCVQAVFMSYISNLNTFGAEKLVFGREYYSGMYSIFSYFWSRWIVEVPFKIVLPFIYATISYWMIGFQSDGERFILYVIIMILLDNVGGALAIWICALFPDVQQAMQAGPALLIPLMVFSGFYINLESIGWWFRWLSYVSPVRYGYVGVMKNEMSGLVFSCDNTNGQPCRVQTGDQDLSLLSMENEPSVGFSIGILSILLGGFLIFAQLILLKTTKR